ncbi:short chain dehydrogenase [Ceratobasidium sp. AG-Ba]|nr:short chain dehydrogenase [Ceratobasidium sp. AG-Ba]
MSSQPWKCALVTGGGGGLGKAFARSLISRGKKVYLAGRTESNIAETTQEIGAAGYFVVDVANVAALPTFVDKVIHEAPDLDCLINNAGIQVNLCALLVPHLLKQDHGCIMNIGSGMGYLPRPQYPIYCATKAFVKYFTLTLREQLWGTNVKVIEISPPLVLSGNLARSYAPAGEKLEQFKAELKKRGVVGLTEEEWMIAVEKGWDEGKEEIGCGFSQLGIDKWREAFGSTYSAMNGH